MNECLSSLEESIFKDYEIIIVDNNSKDDSIIKIKNKFSYINIISLKENLGYAGGCNMGARESNGKFLLFLNNDTTHDSNWLDPLVNLISSDNKIYTDNQIITDKDKIMDIFKTYQEYAISYYNTTIIALPSYRNNKYLGHLINDKGYKFGKIYKLQLNNCCFDDNGLDIISTRDIKKGEELYVTYGKEYWYGINNIDRSGFTGKSKNEIIKEKLNK